MTQKYNGVVIYKIGTFKVDENKMFNESLKAACLDTKQLTEPESVALIEAMSKEAANT